MEENLKNENILDDIEEEIGTKTKFNKYYIIIPIVAVLLIGSIIFIIFYFTSKNDGNKSNENNKTKDIISNITATYVSTLDNEKIKIINSTYLENIISMEIDNQTINNTDSYIFKNKGKHIIYFKINLKNLNSLDYMFCALNKLNSISFPQSFDTKNIISMNHMFFFCSNLISIDISNFNIEKVENISYMFYGCSLLTTIKLPNSKSPNLIDIRNLFFNCNNLNSIDLSNFNSNKIFNMEYIFWL